MMAPLRITFRGPRVWPVFGRHYEQTNIEYFEVVEARGKYVWLRELQQERKETGWLQGTCKPVPGKYREGAETLRRLAQKNGVKIDDVRSAWRGGEERHWSAYH